MVETEVKLPLRSTASDACARIERHGYTLREPRTLQVDQVFDRADGELRKARSLLRVRSVNGTATLTYKGPPLAATPYKSREELEASTSDVEPLFAILDRLGFALSFRYEKFRTVFAAPGEPGILALDETPIGLFLELEGPGDWIDATAQRLGWSPQDYVTLSYATLYLKHREVHGGPPNMTF